METFLEFINNHIPLEPEEIEMFTQGLKVRTFKKKEIILSEGQIATRFFFNSKGFVRLYYNVDGDEKTAFFYPKNNFVSDYESYVMETPSKMNFQAMEDTTLIEISKDLANEGLLMSPKLMALAIKMMEHEFIIAQNLIRSALTESPEKRYYDLIKESPEIFQKVPQQHIASYLGIAPESLSRIKKRHFDKILT